MGYSPPSGPGGWRPPPELGTVALWCQVSRRPSARALLCRAVSYWRWPSRGSSTRPALHWQSHAKHVVPPSMGYSPPSGPGGWRPPPELGTVASWCQVPRRPSARALLCRAVSYWRWPSRGSSTRARAALAVTREARGTSIDGLQPPQRAWGLAPASRARHRRVMVSGVAPSQRARAIVPCRLILAVAQPWLQHARPRCTGSHTRSTWYLHRWATAPPAGLGAGARLPSSAPSRHGVRCRAVPARARYCAVPSHTGGGPAVAPARAPALHWQSHAKHVVPPSMGYSPPSGPGGWRPPPELGTVASWCQVSRRPSARALLCRAVSYWRWPSRGSSTRARAALAVTREARGTSIDGLQPPQRAWGLAPASRARHRRVMVSGAAPSQRARAIVPCRLILAVAQPWLQHARPRCTGSHTRSTWYLHRWATAPPAGLGAGARLPSSAPSRYGVRCRAVPARARYCAVPSHTGGGPAVAPARAPALHWQSHAKHVVPPSMGYSPPSGPGGWRPPPELGTVALWCQVPRRPSARALLCRAVSYWRWPSRGSSTRARAALAVTREARGTSIDGLQPPQRAWGLAPASRARHRRVMVSGAAPSQRARAIVPCRLILAVAQPWLQHARPRCTGSHTRSTWYLHRWATAPPAGLGAGARLPSSAPSRYGVRCRAVPARARYCAVPSHTGGGPAVAPARAPALHWQSHAKHVVPPSMGYSPPSGPGGWRPPPELGTVALWCQVSRRPSARALLCRAVSYWRWPSRGSSTRARAALAVTREARGTSIDGLQPPQRAWGLAPASRARHRRVMVSGAAPSQRARAIVPCRLILAVAQPWLQHARPRCTGSHTRSTWYLHRWATAPPAGLGAGARLPSSAPSRYGVRCRAVPARARYCAVPSHTGGGPAVAPARAPALHWQSHAKHVVPPSMGYSPPSGPGGWRPPPELGTVALWCQVSRRPSARALLCRAVSYWRWPSRGSSTRARAALAVTREARGTSIDGLQPPQRAWGLAPASRARHRRVMVSGVAPSQRARAIVPCRLILAVAQPWLQHAARAALAVTREARGTSIDGLQPPQRAWGLAPASRARHRRVMVSGAAPSQRARAIVPCRLILAVAQPWLQHAPRAALAVTREARGTSIDGLQPPQRAWGLAPASRARHRRVMVSGVAPSQRARAIVPCRLILAVAQPWLQHAPALHWQSHAKHVVPPSMGYSPPSGPGGWRPPPELGTVALWCQVPRRPSARAIDAALLALSCLQRGASANGAGWSALRVGKNSN